jgi:hypothetical protein
LIDSTKGGMKIRKSQAARCVGSSPIPPEVDWTSILGSSNLFARKKIGAKIVVENMPGAGRIMAAKKLKEAGPNGLTQGILNAPGLLGGS